MGKAPSLTSYSNLRAEKGLRLSYVSSFKPGLDHNTDLHTSLIVRNSTFLNFCLTGLFYRIWPHFSSNVRWCVTLTVNRTFPRGLWNCVSPWYDPRGGLDVRQDIQRQSSATSVTWDRQQNHCLGHVPFRSRTVTRQRSFFAKVTSLYGDRIEVIAEGFAPWQEDALTRISPQKRSNRGHLLYCATKTLSARYDRSVWRTQPPQALPESPADTYSKAAA